MLTTFNPTLLHKGTAIILTYWPTYINCSLIHSYLHSFTNIFTHFLFHLGQNSSSSRSNRGQSHRPSLTSIVKVINLQNYQHQPVNPLNLTEEVRILYLRSLMWPELFTNKPCNQFYWLQKRLLSSNSKGWKYLPHFTIPIMPFGQPFSKENAFFFTGICPNFKPSIFWAFSGNIWENLFDAGHRVTFSLPACVERLGKEHPHIRPGNDSTYSLFNLHEPTFAMQANVVNKKCASS